MRDSRDWGTLATPGFAVDPGFVGPMGQAISSSSQFWVTQRMFTGGPAECTWDWHVGRGVSVPHLSPSPRGPECARECFRGWTTALAQAIVILAHILAASPLIGL